MAQKQNQQPGCGMAIVGVISGVIVCLIAIGFLSRLAPTSSPPTSTGYTAPVVSVSSPEPDTSTHDDINEANLAIVTREEAKAGVTVERISGTNSVDLIVPDEVITMDKRLLTEMALGIHNRLGEKSIVSFRTRQGQVLATSE